MQFLFVVLMSVLVGASSVPYYFNANKRPSYSLRKMNSARLASIPKSEISIESPSLLASQSIKVDEQNLAPTDIQQESAQASSSSSETPNARGTSTSLDVELDRELASYVGPEGLLMIDEADLKSCVCQSNNLMRCNLWVDGACSDMDEYVSIVARSPASDEYSKNLRCKENSRFNGFLTVFGDRTLRLKVSFRDKVYQKDFSLTNHCGVLENIKSSDEE